MDIIQKNQLEGGKQEESQDNRRKQTNQNQLENQFLQLEYIEFLCPGKSGDFPGQKDYIKIPAIVPVIKAARVPPIIALKPIRARSWRRAGAIPPIPPI